MPPLPPDPAAARPPLLRDERAWLVPFQPFLAKLGGGNSQVGTGLAATLVATALLYSRCLGNEFVYDDFDWSVKNRYLGDWSFIWKSFVNDAYWFNDPLHLPQSSYYRPLLDLWAALNFHLFGLHPAGWHVAMIALYLVVVWLVFRVASHLSADPWTGVLAAALFALMPAHAEGVVWPSAICQPLLAGFELGAFEFYLRGRASSGPDSRRWLRLALSLALFAGALLSYESASVFPVLIAAHSFISPLSRSFAGEGKHAVFWRARVRVQGSPLQKGEGLGKRFPLPADDDAIARARNALAAAWPYALEVAAYLAVRIWVLGFITRPNPQNPHPPTALEAALTIPRAIVEYVMLLLMPWRAGPAHRLDIIISVAAPGFCLPVAGLAVLCGAGYFLLRRHPRHRLYLFCAAWFLITLAPMLNLRGLFAECLIQDRYLYFPSFGFCVMAADLAVTFARGSERRAELVWTGAAVVALLYAALLLSVQRFWHDEVTLFSRCVEAAPQAELWHYQFGMALMARSDFAGARTELETAARLEPGNVAAPYQLALAYENLGNWPAAERAMAAWLKRYHHPPPGAYTELALTADAAGDSKTAEAALVQAEAIPGGAFAAALARAKLRFSHGDSKGAEQAVHELLLRDPDNVYALAALGGMLAAQRRYDEALAVYRHIALLTPRAPPLLHYLVALTLHQLGREREARDECAIALAEAPNSRSVQALMAEIERGAARH